MQLESKQILFSGKFEMVRPKKNKLLIQACKNFPIGLKLGIMIPEKVVIIYKVQQLYYRYFKTRKSYILLT